MTIAEVLIFRGVPTLYSYTIPEPLNDTIVSGTQVIIPFGRSTVKGLVFNITNKEDRIDSLVSINKHIVNGEDRTIVRIIFFISIEIGNNFLIL